MQFQHFCIKILLFILYTVVGLCECVYMHIWCVCVWSCEGAPDLRPSIDRYNSGWSLARPSSHVFSGNLYELHPPPGSLWPLALQASVDPSLCLLTTKPLCSLHPLVPTDGQISQTCVLILYRYGKGRETGADGQSSFLLPFGPPQKAEK